MQLFSNETTQEARFPRNKRSQQARNSRNRKHQLNNQKTLYINSRTKKRTTHGARTQDIKINTQTSQEAKTRETRTQKNENSRSNEINHQKLKKQNTNTVNKKSRNNKQTLRKTT